MKCFVKFSQSPLVPLGQEPTPLWLLDEKLFIQVLFSEAIVSEVEGCLVRRTLGVIFLVDLCLGHLKWVDISIKMSVLGEVPCEVHDFTSLSLCLLEVVTATLLEARQQVQNIASSLEVISPCLINGAWVLRPLSMHLILVTLGNTSWFAHLSSSFVSKTELGHSLSHKVGSF